MYLKHFGVKEKYKNDENDDKIIFNSFSFDFAEEVYGTRITVVTNSVTSTKNLGRVVLDNMTLTY